MISILIHWPINPHSKHIQCLSVAHFSNNQQWSNMLDHVTTTWLANHSFIVPHYAAENEITQANQQQANQENNHQPVNQANNQHLVNQANNQQPVNQANNQQSIEDANNRPNINRHKRRRLSISQKAQAQGFNCYKCLECVTPVKLFSMSYLNHRGTAPITHHILCQHPKAAARLFNELYPNLRVTHGVNENEEKKVDTNNQVSDFTEFDRELMDQIVVFFTSVGLPHHIVRHQAFVSFMLFLKPDIVVNKLTSYSYSSQLTSRAHLIQESLLSQLVESAQKVVTLSFDSTSDRRRKKVVNVMLQKPSLSMYCTTIDFGVLPEDSDRYVHELSSSVWISSCWLFSTPSAVDGQTLYGTC